MKVQWKPSPFTYLCSLHFKTSDYVTTCQRRRLRPSAVPSIFSFTKSQETSDRAKRYDDKYLKLSAYLAPSSSKEPDERTKEQLSECKRELHNARRREKRLRTTLETVLKDLKEAGHLNQELKEKLELFKGTFSVCSFLSIRYEKSFSCFMRF